MRTAYDISIINLEQVCHNFALSLIFKKMKLTHVILLVPVFICDRCCVAEQKHMDDISEKNSSFLSKLICLLLLTINKISILLALWCEILQFLLIFFFIPENDQVLSFQALFYITAVLFAILLLLQKRLHCLYLAPCKLHSFLLHLFWFYCLFIFFWSD